MSKPLPRIACNRCNLSQDYRGQADCIHCNQRLNNWSVASQLKVQENNAQMKSWKTELNNDSEQDGA